MSGFIFSGNNKKASILIFALGVFTILSLFTLSLGMSTYLQVKKTKFFIAKKRGYFLALSGIKLAKYILKQDENNVDHVKEDWFQEIVKELSFSYPGSEAVLTVNIKDESSRININGIDWTKSFILENLFQDDDINISDSSKKIEFILDYIDSDDQPRRIDSEKKAKDEKLAACEEMLLIDDITLDDYVKIRDYITVFGDDGKVNINTASGKILQIMIKDEFVRDEVFKKRYGENNTEGDEDDGYYEQEQDIPLLVRPLFKVNSQFFRIESSARVSEIESKIICILNKNSGKIIYSYEK